MKRTIQFALVFLFSLLFASTAFAGWVSDDIGWKYVKHDGSYYSDEWFHYDGKWYYFGPDGYMVHDQWVSGLYYVDSNGEMLKDAITPDLYYVGKNGKYYNVKNEKGQKVYTDVFNVQDAVVTVTVMYPDRLTGSKSGITHVFLDDFGVQYDNKLWCGLEYIPNSSNGQYKSRTQKYTISRTVNGETTVSEGSVKLYVNNRYYKRDLAYLLTVDTSGIKSADGKVHVNYLVMFP